MADPKLTDSSRGQSLPPVPWPDRSWAGICLPTPLTSFIGRQREIALVVDTLRSPGVRLVTLTGPGGVGKTRLALRAATEVADDYPDGVWFVPLAPVRDLALITTAIAQVVGVREPAAHGVEEGVAGFLRQRRALLVLDNFEHLLEAGPMVAALLASCPALTVLVTSRAVLHVSGEHDVAVPPLSLARHGEEEATCRDVLDALGDAPEAVRLFVERARAARADFALTAENRATVTELCRRLDGLPLAIELAAARVNHLPLSTLLDRLEPRLPLLTGGPRDQPARLRTMRDAIAWSYDLLTSEEQTLFRRLAVFVGGFTLEAAAAVARTETRQNRDVLDGIAALVDKSLVQMVDESGAEPRCQLLETVREYGLEQLAASGEIEETRQAHGSYFLALAEQAAPAMNGPRLAEWLARLDADHANLRTALEWFGRRGEAEAVLRQAAALWNFWFIRGHNREGRAWLAHALAVSHGWSPALRDALHGASMLASNQGDYLQAAAYAEELLASGREQGDREGVGRAQFLRSFAATYQGHRAQARSLAEEALTVFCRLGDPHWIGIALNRLAIECHIQGDFARAEALYDEALGVWRARGDTWGLAFVTTNLGVNAQAQGDIARAAAHYRESMLHLRTLGESWGDDELLPLVAALATASGQWEQAARLIGATDGLLEVIGYALPPFVHVFYELAVTSVRRKLGEEGFAAGREAGRRLTRGQASREAFEVVSALADGPASADLLAAASHGLTPRELEVLRLVAEGRSNREIAEVLFIGVPTVKRHLTNVLGKLGVPSRSAATSYAHTHGLV
jgi:predicted ATPase/DNA-binding CsgD family transcriptional regulator